LYSGSDKAKPVAWYGNNKTYPVGTKQPNEAGIYDMSGNVWEWCNDWYGRYKAGDQINPEGPEHGTSKVIRGGSWSYHADRCRVAFRGANSPKSGSKNLGFRIVLEL
jgi:formylglycine-generating enzyme required for sulfatase activity